MDRPIATNHAVAIRPRSTTSASSGIPPLEECISLRRPSHGCESSDKTDEQRIDADRVINVPEQQPTRASRMVWTAAGQTIQTNSTGEAEALMSGDKLQAVQGKPRQVRRYRATRLFSIEEA